MELLKFRKVQPYVNVILVKIFAETQLLEDSACMLNTFNCSIVLLAAIFACHRPFCELFIHSLILNTTILLSEKTLVNFADGEWITVLNLSVRRTVQLQDSIARKYLFALFELTVVYK